MNAKELVDVLLEILDTVDLPNSAMDAVEAVNDALQVGQFDCLVEHPGDEPPDNCRFVLAWDGVQWRTGQYLRPPRRGSRWLVKGIETKNNEMFVWRELPPKVERVAEIEKETR